MDLEWELHPPKIMFIYSEVKNQIGLSASSDSQYVDKRGSFYDLLELYLSFMQAVTDTVAPFDNRKLCKQCLPEAILILYH